MSGLSQTEKEELLNMTTDQFDDLTVAQLRSHLSKADVTLPTTKVNKSEYQKLLKNWIQQNGGNLSSGSSAQTPTKTRSKRKVTSNNGEEEVGEKKARTETVETVEPTIVQTTTYTATTVTPVAVPEIITGPILSPVNTFQTSRVESIVAPITTTEVTSRRSTRSEARPSLGATETRSAFAGDDITSTRQSILERRAASPPRTRSPARSRPSLSTPVATSSDVQALLSKYSTPTTVTSRVARARTPERTRHLSTAGTSPVTSYSTTNGTTTLEKKTSNTFITIALAIITLLWLTFFAYLVYNHYDNLLVFLEDGQKDSTGHAIPCPANAQCVHGYLKCNPDFVRVRNQCVEDPKLDYVKGNLLYTLEGHLSKAAGEYECGNSQIPGLTQSEIKDLVSADPRVELTNQQIESSLLPTILRDIQAGAHKSDYRLTFRDGYYVSEEPSFSIQCIVKMWAQRNILPLFLSLLALIGLAYIYYLLRKRTMENRKAAEKTEEAHKILKTMKIRSQQSGRDPYFAAHHLKEEVLPIKMTNRTSRNRIWKMVEENLKVDARISHNQMMVDHEPCTVYEWTAPLLEDAPSDFTTSPQAAISGNTRVMDRLSFDKSGSIRVLDQEKYDTAKNLQEQCSDFVKRTDTFEKIVSSFMELVEKKARLIEAEKLKAIGLRNLVESERDVRKRKQREMQTLIQEKQAELDRYTKQYQSILQVQTEQRVLIEKLSNNEI
ncbi:hypothetical protein PROFUN_00197 [Planoprotostelium fungivorum]|uniref:Man1/Src1-like C-terminal domain-containing protein n=1 Tax=Planoprotostelium fungivorum TaxID=1890364 RepID=A0A2P6P0X1_9EUKA|nr:hypothetical protein PROFUN_00197 [Planoprotostelium fungivorum]